MDEKLGWEVEVNIKVKGPKEGAVYGRLYYEDTTKEVAVEVQNALMSMGLMLNGADTKGLF